MALSYHITTYGCQMNVHDSEVMAGLLEDRGWARAADPAEADLVILNTCCVRETAEERILGRLGELQALKRDNPDLVLVVAGCLGQEAGAAERIRRRAANVDVVMGTHNLHRLPELVEKAVRTRGERAGRPIVEVWEDRAGPGEGLAIRREAGVRAWVTIMHGCDNFCSYCIVPYVRGRQVSRLPEDIHREVEGLVDRGFREVTLLGQNVNAYGQDLGRGAGHGGEIGSGGDHRPRPTFAGLLRDLDGVAGLLRIRYTTSHPKDFTEDIIAAAAECRKVCEHFHLPAQSGSSRILKLMNRRYSREDYLRLVDRIRARIPEAAFTTDLIVGFPGETEADFEETLSLVREVGFDGAFSFAYSPRIGTPAAASAQQVPAAIKQSRLRRLIDVQNEVGLARNRDEVGRTVSVLVEGEAEKRPGWAAGRSRTNKLVLFQVDAARPTATPPTIADLVGREVAVRVERATTWSLEGRATP